MTRDQIIRMARDAGIRLMGDGFGKPDRTDVWATQEEFERFAALVAAAELRRLHELNAELVEALKELLDMPEADGTFSMGKLRKSIKDQAKAALAKAQGEEQ